MAPQTSLTLPAPWLICVLQFRRTEKGVTASVHGAILSIQNTFSPRLLVYYDSYQDIDTECFPIKQPLVKSLITLGTLKKNFFVSVRHN